MNFHWWEDCKRSEILCDLADKQEKKGTGEGNNETIYSYVKNGLEQNWARTRGIQNLALYNSFQFYRTQNRKLDEGRRKRREEVGGKGGKKGHQ